MQRKQIVVIPTNTHPVRGSPILTKGPQIIITLGPQGAPYFYDFGAPGPQNFTILGPRGPHFHMTPVRYSAMEATGKRM